MKIFKEHEGEEKDRSGSRRVKIASGLLVFILFIGVLFSTVGLGLSSEDDLLNNPISQDLDTVEITSNLNTSKSIEPIETTPTPTSNSINLDSVENLDSINTSNLNTSKSIEPIDTTSKIGFSEPTNSVEIPQSTTYSSIEPIKTTPNYTSNSINSDPVETFDPIDNYDPIDPVGSTARNTIDSVYEPNKPIDPVDSMGTINNYDGITESITDINRLNRLNRRRERQRMLRRFHARMSVEMARRSINQRINQIRIREERAFTRMDRRLSSPIDSIPDAIEDRY